MILDQHPVRTLPLFALVLLLAAAPLALAQGPGGPGGGHGPGPGAGPGPDHGGFGVPLNRLAAYLRLSDEQIAEAQEIFTAAREAAAPIRETQKALHEELRALLDGENPDPTAVGEVVLDLHANRQELRTLRQAAFADFEALLTAEQLEKLERLKEMRNHFGHRRGGGPGAGQGAAQGLAPGFGPGFGPACGDCPNL